jgi:hypothetical protein
MYEYYRRTDCISLPAPCFTFNPHTQLLKYRPTLVDTACEYFQQVLCLDFRINEKRHSFESRGGSFRRHAQLLSELFWNSTSECVLCRSVHCKLQDSISFKFLYKSPRLPSKNLKIKISRSYFFQHGYKTGGSYLKFQKVQ